MKSFVFLISIALSLFFTTGCEKSKNNGRKKYVGTWEMTITSDQIVYTTDMGGNTVTNQYSSTWVNSNVEISIDEQNENGLIIDFYPNSMNSYKNEILLDKNGGFSKCCGLSSPCVIDGDFKSKNKMSMEMENQGRCNGASAGGTSHQSVTGVKL